MGATTTILRSLAAPPAITLLLAVLASPAHSQFGKVLGRFDVETLTGNGNLQGIEFGKGKDPWNSKGPPRDFLWLTGTRTVTTGPHQLYLVDVHPPKGVSMRFRAFDVPAGVNKSSTGLYDLAYDEVGNVLYAGTDTSVSKTLFAFDCKTLQFGPGKNVTLRPTALAAIRGLAYDSVRKEFFVKDGSSAFEIFDSTGQRTKTYVSTAPYIHGLAHRGSGPDRSVASFGQCLPSAPVGYPGSQVVVRWHAIVLRGIPFLLNHGNNSVADATVPARTGVAPGGLAKGLAWAQSADHGENVLWCLQDGARDHAVAIVAHSSFGRGCQGGSKIEPLAGANRVPYVGNSLFRPYVGGLSTNATHAALFMGSSNQTWMGNTLPITLPFGTPLCRINIAADWLIGVVPTQPSGTFNMAGLVLPIPNAVGLRGLEFYTQWLILDPALKTGVHLAHGSGRVIK